MSEIEVLIVYYSVRGSTAILAREVAHGVESTPGVQARIRTVPRISAHSEQIDDAIPASGPPYATYQDLRECAALALGSPTRFGNMAAPVKYFIDGTAQLWLDGAMVGKPAGVFTAASSPHGGHESTLLSMQIPLLHHGMLICGVPYTQPALNTTPGGGSPYGPSHWSGAGHERSLDRDEAAICRSLGQRLAHLAVRLA
ncbi:MAG: NAD(P)H:quinone oxidoreductase [Gammaproteobacteria bacterium]|nr:NAD(P)H:quinone oxidoreductase [Gammaproteobacteria bacterium]